MRSSTTTDAQPLQARVQSSGHHKMSRPDLGEEAVPHGDKGGFLAGRLYGSQPVSSVNRTRPSVVPTKTEPSGPISTK